MISSARLTNSFRRRMGLVLPGIAALLIVLLLQTFEPAALRQAGLLLFDSYQRLAPRAYEDAAVKVVDIDDESIRKLGQWPWPRTMIADLTQRLTDAGAAAVAFDVVFAESDRTSPARIAEQLRRGGGDPEALATLSKLPDNDAVLAETFARTPTVLAFFMSGDKTGGGIEPKQGLGEIGDRPNLGRRNYPGAIMPLPALREAAPGLGFVTLVPDSDGIVRKAPMLLAQGEQLFPALELEAFRVAMQTESVKIKSTNGSGEIGDGSNVASIQVGGELVPTTSDGQLYMYYTAPGAPRVVPAWSILTGQMSAAQMQTAFQGQVVFIGTGAQGLRDLVATPVQDREAGVMVHAQALEQIILKKFLSRPDWARGAEVSAMLFFGLLLALLLPWMGATRGALLGLAMVIAMVSASLIAFRYSQLLLDPTYPVLGLITVYVLETVYTYYREERQRAYIHQAFDRYLSPELVKKIVDDPSRLQLGGEEREMTVLFCDIRQFSRISEKLSPQDIIKFLIGFLTPMCDILLARKATIDKFIGDAILAFWNAPLDDPDQYGNAARGALAMMERLKQLNTEMADQSATPWPGNVQIGIGLNSGPCCVGNMGSAQRLSYSLIGDTVNVASRIEGLTKYYGIGIGVGDALYEHLREFACVPVDHVRVVGRDEVEVLYTLLGDEQLAESQAFRSFATGHDAMGRAYRARAWDEAEALLDKWQSAATDLGLAKLYALMRERIAAYRANPPGADWDGVYGATEK